jgi:hypothetical protein
MCVVSCVSNTVCCTNQIHIEQLRKLLNILEDMLIRSGLQIAQSSNVCQGCGRMDGQRDAEFVRVCTNVGETIKEVIGRSLSRLIDDLIEP